MNQPIFPMFPKGGASPTSDLFEWHSTDPPISTKIRGFAHVGNILLTGPPSLAVFRGRGAAVRGENVLTGDLFVRPATQKLYVARSFPCPLKPRLYPMIAGPKHPLP